MIGFLKKRGGVNSIEGEQLICCSSYVDGLSKIKTLNSLRKRRGYICLKHNENLNKMYDTLLEPLQNVI